jgi:hypothetical protein
MTGASRRRSRAGGLRRRPAPFADSVEPWLANCYRLHVKVGSPVWRRHIRQRPINKRGSKVLYIYFSWRGPGVTIGKKETDMRADPHACTVMPGWGGGGLGWDVAVMMPLQDQVQLCLRHKNIKTDKITIHAYMEPRIAAQYTVVSVQ